MSRAVVWRIATQDQVGIYIQSDMLVTAMSKKDSKKTSNPRAKTMRLCCSVNTFMP